MPKEITHWRLAERVGQSLGEGPLRQAVRACPKAFMLGSVFHDCGYYAGDSRRYDVASLADRLHGAKGEDTFEVLRLAVTRCVNQPISPPAVSFLAGLATHIAADCVFHPFVYYFTGNYYDSRLERRRAARRAHRRLEVLIDLFV